MSLPLRITLVLPKANNQFYPFWSHMHLCLPFFLTKNLKTQPREANRNYTDVLKMPEQSIRTFACLFRPMRKTILIPKLKARSTLEYELVEKPCIRRTPESYETLMANLQLMEKQYTKMDIGNPPRCDMHKPHEGAHALTHSQAILATLSQSFVCTVGNAATWHWLLLQSCAIPSKGNPNKPTNYDSDT
jgi:hypothetical protein